MSVSSPDNGRRVAAAYEWAASLIALARGAVADGADADLAPIRPAIRDLCSVLKSLPKEDAAEWLARLVELQFELARLGHEVVVRAHNSDGSQAVSGEPGE
jgi:hypothetical protein